MLDLVAEVLVVRAQPGPQPRDEQRRHGDHEQEHGHELGSADRDDDEPAREHGDRTEPGLGGLLHHLLDRLHVPDDLDLEDARADA